MNIWGKLIGGATGFDEIALSQTTGTFMEGEQIILNENPTYGTGKLSIKEVIAYTTCLLYTSPSPRDLSTSRMPSSA